jgi:hypothetical protein
MPIGLDAREKTGPAEGVGSGAKPRERTCVSWSLDIFGVLCPFFMINGVSHDD